METVKYEIDPNYDIEKIETEIIKQVPKQTLPNQFYYVINNLTQQCIFVSNSITTLTGYEPEEWTYENILSWIHPDDKAFVDKALYACFKYSMSSVYNKPIQDALVLNYRIKHKNGHYIHIMRNGYCTSMDKDNRMIHNTSMCMVISDFKHDNHQAMILKEGDKILVELHSNKHNAINWKLLSKREQEIVKLLCDNKTSEKIAEKLCLSKHTIDTHRRNILKKLDISNTKELFFSMIMK